MPILTDKNASFGLLRTNTKISGNVKITIDSTGELFLNSIDSDKELSSSRFKKFKISHLSNYELDLYNFFDKGKTPANIVHAVNEITKNQYSTSNAFNKQYDFSYCYGPQYLNSNLYDEDFSFFAPLWMSETLPDYFVILRVDNPLDVKQSTDPSVNTTLDFEGLLSKSKIIKTFDLSDQSKIGKYIRTIKNNQLYPKASLNVRFDDGSMSTWNGISYKNGIMTSKGEMLDNLWKSSSTQIGFEQYITEGYERHGIIDPHLLNLEFLFNDSTADNYTMSRYMGFFVSTIKTGSIRLDGDALFKNRITSGNDPAPKRNDRGHENQEIDFYQANPNGVKLFIKPVVNLIPSTTDITKDRKFWIQDKNKNFHSFTNIENNVITISDTIVNLADFTGIGNTKTQSKGEIISGGGKSHIVIKINSNLLDDDEIIFTWLLGPNKWYKSENNPSNVANPGDYHINVTNNQIFIYDRVFNDPDPDVYTYDWINTGIIYNSDVLPDQTIKFIASDFKGQVNFENWKSGSSYKHLYFDPTGTNSDVAKALATCINSVPNKDFDAFFVDDEVIIRFRNTGEVNNNKFLLTNAANNSVSVNTVLATNYTPYNFVGGSNDLKERIKFSLDVQSKLEGDSWVKSKLGISKIDNIHRFVETLNYDDFGRVIGTSEYKDFGIFTLTNDKDNVSLGQNGLFVVYDLFDISIGLFSFFDIKEMDGDFLDSNYAKSPINQYKKYFDVSLLEQGESYVVKGNGTIDLNGTTYKDGDSFTVPPVPTGGGFFGSINLFPFANKISTGKDYLTFNVTSKERPIVINKKFYDTNGIDDEIKSFPGFSTLKTLANHTEIIDTADVLFTNRNKFFKDSINSEYDFLGENSMKEHALNSRVIPWISKWVYKNGTDVRDNPYRLNVATVFGKQNFSPSFDIKSQNPEGFSHEWYYISGVSKGHEIGSLKDDNTFFSNIFDSTKLLDNKQDYFTDYFTLDTDNLGNSKRTQFRYTLFNYNNVSKQAEAFFRGIKLRIKDTLSKIDDNVRFDGYKFSVILVPQKEDSTRIVAPVALEFIENQKFKNITLVINVVIEDYRTAENNKIIVDSLLLYSLKSKKVINDKSSYTNEPKIKYGDIFLSTSFDFGKSGRNGISGPITIVAKENLKYDSDFRDEIKNLQQQIQQINGKNLHVSFTGKYDYGTYTIPEPISVNKSSFDIVGSDDITNIEYNIQFNGAYAPTNPSIGVKTGSENTPTTLLNGGKNYLEPILERISFGRIAKLINENSSYIKYTTVDENSVASNGNYFIELLIPNSIIKKEVSTPEIDTDIPQELRGINNLGNVFDKTNANFQINRYSGSYEPMFRSVLAFRNQKTDSIGPLNIIDLTYNQSSFNINADNFGIAKNIHYSKISNKEILSLANNNKYKPLYPNVGEISIDSKNLDIFKSNWSESYYNLYVNSVKSESIKGSFEMSESYNFMGAKLMKTPAIIRIQTFNTDEVKQQTIDNTLIISLDIRDRLVRWFLDDGANYEFNKFLLPEFCKSGNLDEATKEYIQKNILGLFDVDVIDTYVKIDKQITGIGQVDSELIDADKIKGGYKLDKNVKVQKKEFLMYDLIVPKDHNNYKHIAISITLKKI
jgi:hypothetical protein